MPENPKHWKNFDYHKWKEHDDRFDHDTFDRMVDISTGIDMSTSEALENYLIELAKRKQSAIDACGGEPPWKPHVYYNKDGDILDVYIAHPEQGEYAKWLTPRITLLLDESTDEIIGFQIWGVSTIEELNQGETK